jgi:hypothetical protein
MTSAREPFVDAVTKFSRADSGALADDETSIHAPASAALAAPDPTIGDQSVDEETGRRHVLPPRRATLPPPLQVPPASSPAAAFAPTWPTPGLPSPSLPSPSSSSPMGGVAGWSTRGPARGPESALPGFERPPTPTVRDVFHRGILAERPQGAEPQPIHELPRTPRLSENRRRAILVVGSACIACAVAAFVVVGVLIGDSPAPARAVGPDAASVAPPTTAAPVAPPPAAAPVAPAPPPAAATPARPTPRPRATPARPARATTKKSTAKTSKTTRKADKRARSGKTTKKKRQSR